MKNLLLVLLTTTSIAFASSAAFAQPGEGRGMRMDPEAQIVELISQLDITSEQETGFREAMQQINEARMTGMRQGGGRRGDGASQSEQERGQGRAAMMEKQAELKEQAQEILATVLSAAQIEKYNELEEARMAKMQERRGGR
ncbi:MAG: hypothetical protein ACSHXZ_03230 [Gammaproteobacteria bacterium]